jgi:hypothetical protein
MPESKRLTTRLESGEFIKQYIDSINEDIEKYQYFGTEYAKDDYEDHRQLLMIQIDHFLDQCDKTFLGAKQQ